jgi:hypothetical protein
MTVRRTRENNEYFYETHVNNLTTEQLATNNNIKIKKSKEMQVRSQKMFAVEKAQNVYV